ncbi:rhomboid family intramembrane serine protease [Sphingomonas sp.]|uniref:rhomboid family intramembrane serine protease n=1 Tax=Sphingomonas sp. TaxID=28214 RepID=UPI0025D9E00F|nr:rhomboid family intramembrane serine protease [Sphingomonas sp.]
MLAPHRTARVTYMLAIVTGLAWIVVQVTGAEAWVAEQAGFIPLRFASSNSGFVVPNWLTPFTATVVHGDLMHVTFNLIMLVYCGRAVEQVLGAVPLVALYLAGAVASAFAQYLVDPSSPVPMIGASGAISAVLAVYALLFSRNEVKALGPIPAHWVRALWLALAWTGVQWLLSFATSRGSYQIATAAHVGGFLVGLALARPLLAWRYRHA